jgi:predicted DNA-binding transcriptional regulator AlpA
MAVTNEKAIAQALADFDHLPDSAYVRLPTVAALRGISPATVWRYAKSGVLPKPVKLGPNITAWRVGDLRHFDESNASAAKKGETRRTNGSQA